MRLAGWALSLLSLLALNGVASADDAKLYKKVMREYAKEQKAWWKAFPKRQNKAIQSAWQNLNDWREHKWTGDSNDIRKEMRTLVAELVELEVKLGMSLLFLARSADPKATDLLFRALMDTTERAAALDRDILESRSVQLGWHDQAPILKRAVLAVQASRLRDFLSRRKDVIEYVEKSGAKRANKADGKKGYSHRVALLDVLAQCGEKAAGAIRPYLQDKWAAVRIAALEAMLASNEKAYADVAPLRRDVNTIVRRALLHTLAAKAPKQPAWIPAILTHYETAAGQERTEALRALRAVTGQTLPDDVERWKTWTAKHKEAIESGDFDRTKLPAAKAGTEETKKGATFFSVRTQSTGIVFLLDWSIKMTAPADFEFEKTRTMQVWHTGDRGWLKEGTYESHEAVVMRELAKTLGGLAEDTRFGVVLLAGDLMANYGKVRDPLVLGLGKLLVPKKRDRAAAARLLEKVRPGWAMWSPQFTGLLVASMVAGVGPDAKLEDDEPRADTVFFLNDGLKRSGRYLLPELEIEAFRRFNRFRRLVVHTIQISDEGEDAKAVMEGYAKASGGRYVHQLQPPAR